MVAFTPLTLLVFSVAPDESVKTAGVELVFTVITFVHVINVPYVFISK